MFRSHAQALLIVLLFSACAPEPAARIDDSIRVELADSVRFENELIGAGYLRRVVVRTGTGVDTLDGVVTDQQPVITGDSVVYGLAYDQQSVADAFAYDVRTQTLRRLTLPEQLFRYSVPRFSSDGGHLAYLAMDSAGRGYAAVAEWPSGRMIYRGVPVRMLETDVRVDAVRWLDTNSFEVRIEMSHSVGGGAQRTRGTLRGLASVVVDTIRS